METLSKLNTSLSELSKDTLEFSTFEKSVLKTEGFKKVPNSNTYVVKGPLGNQCQDRFETCHVVKFGDHDYSMLLSLDHFDEGPVVNSKGLGIRVFIYSNLPFVAGC